MLKAFTRVEATEKVPYDITALDAWSDGHDKYFIVCWDKCHTGIYKLKPEEARAQSSEAVELMRSLKNTTPKPITQVSVQYEYDFFLALSDGEVYVISLSNGQILECLMEKTKKEKAIAFAIDVKLDKSAKRASKKVIKLLVSTKKKIWIFTYKKGNFMKSYDRQSELPLPTVPRGLGWSGENTVTVLKMGTTFIYTVIEPDGKTSEFHQASNLKGDAIMLSMATRELALVLETKTLVISNVDRRCTAQITWSETPLAIAYSAPYFLAVLPNSIVEVRASDFIAKPIIQKLNIDRVRLIAGTGNYTFVANNRDVFYLEPTPYLEQCENLIYKHKMFKMALSVADMIPEPRDLNVQRKVDIKERYAFHLFAQGNFKSAIDLYRAVEADPVQVIALYPNLLPADKRKEIMAKWPMELPPLAGKALEEALQDLVDYINLVRRVLEVGKETQHPPPERWEERNEQALYTLLDTTMLKCFLRTNSYMAGPFVRRRGANIDLHEGEKCLKREGLVEDLVELYHHKKVHDKGLQLLYECHINPPVPSLVGTDATVNYLLLLGNDWFPVIKKYSKWVLENSPDDGLKIFMDRSEQNALDTLKVMWHLEDICSPAIVQKYLEHVVYAWKDTTADIHNALVNLYREKVEQIMNKRKLGASDVLKVRAGTEPGELGQARKILIDFLQSSKHYIPEVLMHKFPQEIMLEEYAILCRRLGRHEAALIIYVHFLKSSELALEHCRLTAAEETELPEGSNVYHSLMSIFISPPDLDLYGLEAPPGCVIEPNISKAVEILYQYYDKIDTASVLKLLPYDTGMDQIFRFLKLVFEACSNRRRQLQVLRGLTCSQHLQVKRESIASFDRAFLVTDDTYCAACGKKLGGAFTRTAKGQLHHVYCEL